VGIWLRVREGGWIFMFVFANLRKMNKKERVFGQSSNKITAVGYICNLLTDAASRCYMQFEVFLLPSWLYFSAAVSYDRKLFYKTAWLFVSTVKGRNVFD
jgi:hypothetical protein